MSFGRARYGRGGRGAVIGHAGAACDLGRVLIAGTAHGLCGVYLGDAPAVLAGELAADYPHAVIGPAPAGLTDWTAVVVGHIAAGSPGAVTATANLPLDLCPTPFQARVWRALTGIPPGVQRTYTEIAGSIGAPGAARAVGRACATNPVSVVIPCHRAVRRDGQLAGYRGGLARKRALIDRERRALTVR